MRQGIRQLATLLIVLQLVAMGQPGLVALGQLTDLEITQGHYEYAPDGTVYIYARGRKDRTSWHIFGIWRDGCPLIISIYRPEVDL